MTRRSIIFALLITTLCHHAFAQAQEESGQSFTARLQLGVENDSNVAVEELDRDSRAGDSLLAVNLNLGFENDFSDDKKLGMGYAFSHDAYDEFSQFDLTTQLLSGNYSQKIGSFSLGGAVRYIVSDLDSEKFLTLRQGAVNVSKLLDKKRFLRAEYTYTDKDLENFPTRNSSKHGIAADLFFFLDGSKKYWVVGYKFEDEDADSAELDRSIHTLTTRYTRKFPLFNRTATGRLNARYQVRDYDAITPSIGDVRDDDRLRVGAELELAIFEDWYVALEYEYSDYQSNLPSADYTQSIVSLRVGWEYDSSQ